MSLTMGLRASAHTIASYRDTFRLLLNYASEQLCRTPTDLTFEDLDANLVGRFLGFVETVRGNSVRSRNTRLSAIRSFFKYVATHEPQLVHHCHRILSIPAKKHERTTITYLNEAEMAALVAAPDSSTWFGRRDRTLLVVALQTGLRVSELINLSRGDIVLGTGAHVRCMGKGRKERATPLRKDSVDALRSWLTERPGNDGDPLFVPHPVSWTQVWATRLGVARTPRGPRVACDRRASQGASTGCSARRTRRRRRARRRGFERPGRRRPAP